MQPLIVARDRYETMKEAEKDKQASYIRNKSQQTYIIAPFLVDTEYILKGVVHPVGKPQ